VAPEAPRDGERHDIVLYLGCNVLRTSHMVRRDRHLRPAGLDYVAAAADVLLRHPAPPPRPGGFG